MEIHNKEIHLYSKNSKLIKNVKLNHIFVVVEFDYCVKE